MATKPKIAKPSVLFRKLALFTAYGHIGGNVGGLSKSKKKILAARKNGKKGGRPKGSKNKPKP